MAYRLYYRGLKEIFRSLYFPADIAALEKKLKLIDREPEGGYFAAADQQGHTLHYNQEANAFLNLQLCPDVERY